MNPDILITIVFASWAVVTAIFSGTLILRSNSFDSQRDARS